MQGNTHIVGGITASLAFAQISNDNPFILVGAGVIGALLPDICHGGSKIGRKFPIISKSVNMLFGHRSFTHSLLFLFLVALLLHIFVPYEPVTAGILIGMASHIFLDMGTKKGVKLFFPVTISVRLPITTKTGSKAEKVVFMMLTMLSVFFSYEIMMNLIQNF
ncbi:metal-dependent hydrolase [Lysinibacillus sp. BPa_S21]|uniref:metal-dependent hydrolase n=1 Tax=Lysinibacillus sp. BPa_S21 TaxID=2932478 RepID=UPI002011BA22|nr:metal-dependent hydrolase [Lysinibacillus sp. BPa_S21]MCL1694318.1 metal-dependent hydrolase [Lysinibacillus sp. BPa_S21]